MVDLGYEASPVTALELQGRLVRIRADVRVVGIEIVPGRVAAAVPLEREGLSFRRRGFEVPLDDRQRARVVRAFTVLSQKPEHAAAWSWVRERLAPNACSSTARVTRSDAERPGCPSTVTGPVSFTLSLRLAGLERPSDVAEPLPKSLIHRNVAGERVHDDLRDLESTWARHAPASSWGGLGSASSRSPAR